MILFWEVVVRQLLPSETVTLSLTNSQHTSLLSEVIYLHF